MSAPDRHIRAPVTPPLRERSPRVRLPRVVHGGSPLDRLAAQVFDLEQEVGELRQELRELRTRLASLTSVVTVLVDNEAIANPDPELPIEENTETGPN